MSINEIIEFIKSNPEIEIKISGFQERDGYFQLSSDPKAGANIGWELSDELKEDIVWQNSGTTSLENLKAEWLPNMKKTLHQDYYYEWEEGIIENKSFLKHLNEFVEENDENSNECDFDGFIEHIQDSFGCFIDEVAGAFDVNDGKCGKGREVGIDELSWCFSDYLKDGQIDISGYLNNKQVFCGGY